MPVHNLSDKTRFGALDSSGMTCCISDRFNRGSNVNTNVKWLRRRAVLNLRRRFFSPFYRFHLLKESQRTISRPSWSGGLWVICLGARLAGGTVVLIGSALGRFTSVCVSAAGTWGVLRRCRLVRLITFSKPEEGLVHAALVSCVWSCIEAFLRRK